MLRCVPCAPSRLLVGLRPIDCSGLCSARPPILAFSPSRPTSPLLYQHFPRSLSKKTPACSKILVSECASGGAGLRQRRELHLLSADPAFTMEVASRSPSLPSSLEAVSTAVPTRGPVYIQTQGCHPTRGTFPSKGHTASGQRGVSSPVVWGPSLSILRVLPALLMLGADRHPAEPISSPLCRFSLPPGPG